ncbi:hypothetical protein [Ornithinimicrobium kibberense]|uniref:hypothetical protein n=1 Tax=Ornithinimicrobium kibberense TaxID=282060 RepID=UPI00361E0E01
MTSAIVPSPPGCPELLGTRTRPATRPGAPCAGTGAVRPADPRAVPRRTPRRSWR